MQFTKKTLIISIVLVLAAFGGWQVAANAGFLPQDEQQEEGKDDKETKLNKNFKSLNKVGGKESPITVEAEPVTRGDLIQTVSAQGRVYTYQHMDLVAEVPGRLIKLHVKDGSLVKKGQVIAEIYDREYQLALKEAEAGLWEARATYLEYDTNLELKPSDGSVSPDLVALEEEYKAKKISKDHYEREKFKLELKDVRTGNRRGDVILARTIGKAEIAIEKARINLEKCVIRAPFSGTVFGVEVSEGSMLSGATVIGKLYNMTDLVVKAQVLESEIASVQKDRRSRVTFTALPDLEELTGHVQAISPFVDEEKKTVETILAIKSKDGRIRPGMFAEAKIDAQIFEDRLMVPKAAILPRDNRKVVFKVSADNRAKWEYVTTGVENDEVVEIVKGNLAPGDMVLTDNHFTMGHDTLVTIERKSK